MILIADSGSTKTDWACIPCDGSRPQGFTSPGVQPRTTSRRSRCARISSTRCLRDSPARRSARSTSTAPGSRSCNTDSCAACCAESSPTPNRSPWPWTCWPPPVPCWGAGAASRRSSGTGTNSCLYDGERITLNIDSLGFILGDEGSGGYLGKRLIRDFIRGDMPEGARAAHCRGARALGRRADRPHLHAALPEPVLCAVQPFRRQEPAHGSLFPPVGGRLLPGLLPQHRQPLPRLPQLPFQLRRIVGYAYRDLLLSVAGEFGMAPGRIIRAPMEGLIDYHTNR